VIFPARLALTLLIELRTQFLRSNAQILAGEQIYISGTLIECRLHQVMITCVVILALLSLLVATEPEG